jgi:uncharacterized delta-60 repeat protein
MDRCVDLLEARRLFSAGILDPAFGNSGVINTTQDAKLYPRDIVVQSDGKILLPLRGSIPMALQRRLSNGLIDTTFGNGGLVTVPIKNAQSITSARIAVQADGKMVITASYLPTGADDLATDVVVVRLKGGGAPDKSFSSDGQMHFSFGKGLDNDSINSIALQSDGKILIGGLTTGSATSTDFAIARITTDGKLDTTFRNTGARTVDFNSRSDSLSSMLIKTDGKIVLTGASVGYSDEVSVAQLNSDGSLDTGFSTDGKANVNLNGPSYPGAVFANGKVIVVGLTGKSDLGFQRLTANGATDKNFGVNGLLKPAGFPKSLDIRQLLRMQDGRYVLLTTSGTSGNQDWIISRFNPDFSLDITFGTGGIVTGNFNDRDDTLNQGALTPDGAIDVVGFSTSTDGNESQPIIAKYLGDIGPISDAILSPDGTLHVNGSNKSDRLLLGTSGANITATINGTMKSFALTAVKRVEVYGFGGNDRLSAEVPVPTLLEGSIGDDTLIGGSGNDTLNGGKGNDRINGGNGRDLISAGAGDDTIFSDDGNIDTVSGSDGNDVAGADDDDVLTGIETVLT